MIMRVWRARVDGARAAEYERFAQEASLPMFQKQPGFQGSLFGRSGDDCVVVTVWDDDEAADSLDVSPSYLETVSQIRATGFVSVELGVERFYVHAGDQLGLGEI
jgi:heme-degrading monooxygenase HmoA